MAFCERLGYTQEKGARLARKSSPVTTPTALFEASRADRSYSLGVKQRATGRTVGSQRVEPTPMTNATTIAVLTRVARRRAGEGAPAKHIGAHQEPVEVALGKTSSDPSRVEAASHATRPVPASCAQPRYPSTPARFWSCGGSSVAAVRRSSVARETDLPSCVFVRRVGMG
jgi:hypothetical protein